MVIVRRASPADAPGIARVKAAAWPEESLPDPDHIARVLAQPEHAAHVALDGDGSVLGFVDGFVTLSPTDALRWEVDLLAVHPDCQGRGIGRALVEVSTAAGQEMGVSFARALIRVDNVGSQRAFARCGYRLDGAVCALYISQPVVETRQAVSLPHIPTGEAHFVSVTTFTYRGLWLEGGLGAEAFQAAQAIRDHNGWDVAGAVIPPAQPEAIRAAEAAGYTLVGPYQWWIRAC